MNNKELIEKYELELKDVQLKFGSSFKTKVYEELLYDLKQLDKPEPIKLRDVIARIKQLDIGTRKVWLDEFLNDLGSDFGSAKYKDGYEQGKLEGEWVGQQLKDADKIRRELNKPVVKQFVADWYEDNKDDLEFNIWDWIKYTQEEEKIQNRQFTEWLGESDNDPIETLVKMKLFGYTVEKEERYFVRLKGVVDNLRLLRHNLPTNTWTIGSEKQCFNVSRAHTRKELEDASFGWVFDCPGIEIEEVEE